MKIVGQSTDSAILVELGTRLMHARLLRNLTQDDLANAAGVSKRTVERLEAGHSVQLTNLIRVLRALFLLQNLEQLIPPKGPTPLEQLRLRGKERRRASTGKSADTVPTNWHWGEK
jgi:transcriptional regulator with XRE-family HTH domain